MAEPTDSPNPSPQRPAPEAAPPSTPPPQPVPPHAPPVPESVATGRDNPPREAAVGNRAAGTPTAAAEGAREGRADAGREDDSRRQDERPSPAVNPMVAGQGLSRARDYDPYNLDRRRPGPVHGATHRVRQDDGLGPDDVVELMIRHGRPPGGWVDVEAHGGLDALRELRGEIGANSRGINLIAAHGEYVDPLLVRNLRAGSIPARLVRRTGEG